jgi:hypothetical protein
LSASEDIDLASLRIELTQRDSPDGENLFASQRLVLAFLTPDEIVAAINFRTKNGQFVNTLWPYGVAVGVRKWKKSGSEALVLAQMNVMLINLVIFEYKTI